VSTDAGATWTRRATPVDPKVVIVDQGREPSGFSWRLVVRDGAVTVQRSSIDRIDWADSGASVPVAPGVTRAQLIDATEVGGCVALLTVLLRGTSASSAFKGQLVLRSCDGGGSWSRVPFPDAVASTAIGVLADGSDLLVVSNPDPKRPGVITRIPA
jgi:hypothetical protein